MNLSGINTFSLIDYPQKTCCVVFTLGCNFRCPFCHNPDFVLPDKVKENSKKLISLKSFFNFLEKRKGLLDAVSICGGEPTIQKDLEKFCSQIKKMGFLVKIDTNGRDPKLLKRLIKDNLVDYVAMDIKNPIGRFSELSGVSISEKDYIESIDILLKSDIDYEFRTTLIKGVHTKKDIKDILEYIKGAKNYYLQNYRAGNTLQINFEGEPFREDELLEFESMGKKYIKNIGYRN